MKGIVFLTWRYLTHRPWRSLILVLSLALIIYLPLAIQVFVAESSRLVMQRAEATPLILGRRGSEVELTLNSLYFTPQKTRALTYKDYTALNDKKRGQAVPLHVVFRAGDYPIVGTSSVYFKKRMLHVDAGVFVDEIGQCVIGAQVARERGLNVGDSIASTPGNIFDLAGAYPLLMNVVGILKEAHSADDQAVFVSLKTAWILEGLGHGHDLIVDDEPHDGVERFTQITADNAESFHFHGDEGDFPLSAVLAFPEDPKDQALLLADYQGDDSLQLVKPQGQLQSLLETLFSTKDLVFYGFLTLAGMCLILLIFVWSLALRLREGELNAYRKIGMTQRARVILKVADLMVIVLLGAIVAVVGLWVTGSVAASLLPALF